MSSVHSVQSARADLAGALNASAGVRQIKIGKQALNKLIGQAEDLIEADEVVEFGAYHYERGLTMVTYYLVLVTDKRVLRVNRTSWKLKPWFADRSTITSVDVGAKSDTPLVTLRRGAVVVAPFRLERADADRLREVLALAAE